MNYESAREEIKDRWEEILNRVTSPAKQRVNGRTSYICPFCGHGTHGDGLTFNPKGKDGRGLKCFGSCGFSGDIIDLIGKLENITDYTEQLKRAGEYIGITIDGYREENQNQPKNEQHTDMDIHTYTYTQTDTEVKDNMAYYRECQSHLKETAYLSQRGISEETAKRFMLGYDPHYTKGTGGAIWQALIIPTGRYSYVARNTDPEAGDKERYRKTGSATPLNTKALENATQPIFITEGEIDALSIIEVGGEAIGLGSTANVNIFINDYIKKQEQKPAQPLVLALDNDTSGQSATEELATKLTALGVPFYRIDPYNGLKDANTALVTDREAFTQSVKQAIAQVESMEADTLKAEREEYLKNSAYNHLQEFINGIAESANTPAQTTGFSNLDTILDGGLYEGLYIIGAITSLGKTTFALQIADQIAESGRDVLIFSLEMARAELMSKSISRQTLLDVLRNGGEVRNAKTNRGITAGARYKNYSQEERELIARAIKAYSQYASHIYIQEGIGDIGVKQIREKIQMHIALTGQAPVVLIDYIQILAPYDVRATDKQNTDKAVLELKRISRDFKIPVIGISSFNRDNYTAPVNLTSFKESGAIEYSSDVLIGLQYEGMDYSASDKTEKDREKRVRDLLTQAIADGNSGNAQSIQVKVLKQRNGGKGDTVLKFYPLFNYFMES